MDNEKLQAANALTGKIKTVKLCLEKWKGACQLYDGGINLHWSLHVVNENNPEGYTTHNNSNEKASPETFTVVKALNIDYWQRELDRLEKEFENI